jgi:hypothetical protein
VGTAGAGPALAAYYVQIRLDPAFKLRNGSPPAARRILLRCQYRSAIFVHSADQQALAIAWRDTDQPSLTRPIVI